MTVHRGHRPGWKAKAAAAAKHSASSGVIDLSGVADDVEIIWDDEG